MPMIVTGGGYIPGNPVRISSDDGSVSVQTTANSAGNIAVTTGSPRPVFKRPGSKRVVLTAQAFTAAGAQITGQTIAKTTELSVATVPATAKPSHAVTWYFSGFRRGRYIYGHYLHRHHQVARLRFGRAKGVCGLLRVRARFFPRGHKEIYRRYGLQLDNVRRYSKRSRPRIDTSLLNSL
ncbi:MAG: hypothetical protein M3016_06640 [Actinomycetota bacterium]|nr:hypothetical protein [Actinomycetota bacterium]